MKLKQMVLAVGLMLLLPSAVRADEGMWLLSLIGKNYADMQQAGFKLTPEDIYSINQSCLKDAVVGLGREGMPFSHFCTGEIVSDKGLMTTNHHCGYGQLQRHSSVSHDYLQDGFWAYSMDQELPCPGITASILVRMEDVTDAVVRTLSDDMSEAERAKAIAEVSKEIADDAVRGTKFQAGVRSMFNGNQFFLFVHMIYRDIRLVGAPPSSMGKFGGDTDNWSWPRHTCDFSMFRIYTAPDGSPTAYAAENVPLRPKHHLPISIGELRDGDYAMVMGFPGQTQHYITSYGLNEVINVTNRLRHDIRDVKINILREEMAASQATRIKYASKYASCSNYWKYSSEQNKALENLNTMSIKLDVENEYRDWARDKDPKYLRALELLSRAYTERRPYAESSIYLSEGLWNGPELLNIAVVLGNSVIAALEDKDNTDQRIAAIRESMVTPFYKDYDEQTERRLEAGLFEYVNSHMDQNFCPQFLGDADRKYKGNWQRCVNDMFAKSVFANEATLLKFLQKPSKKAIEKDPLYIAGKSVQESGKEISKQLSNIQPDLVRGNRDFVDGILQINRYRRLLSPDANSTIRLTYGNVKAYEPRDAVAYSYYTTLQGVMEKEDPASSEFAVPARLKELYAARDYGRYANSKGELPTCFITNNDITGGNSGSPVINARGELIGLAFDGNGEAMSGDIDFEENLQRCICLDSRYMLWVIDKYAGATNLINEMTIVQ